MLLRNSVLLMTWNVIINSYKTQSALDEMRGMSILAYDMKGDHPTHRTADMMYHIGNRVHGRGANQRFYFRDYFQEEFYIEHDKRNDYPEERVSWNDYHWFIPKYRGASVTKWQALDAEWDAPGMFQ
jgi:hypothetical protein